MIEEGSKVHIKKPGIRSMTAWGKLKKDVPNLVCPCKVDKSIELTVLSVLSRRLVLAQGFKGTEEVDVVLDIEDVQLPQRC